ncbi:MAG: hypothetical protein IKL55_00335 [Clostridia bacterium]|nr:hypothetical protein [Clostridia bacterium]
MQIPSLLEYAIEKEIEKYNIKELKDAALNLSKRYMENKRTGESFFKTYLDTISYSVIRMPATYSAIRTCLEKIIELKAFKINSLLDIGSGTGAAEWAALDVFDINDIVCLEREKAMRDLSKNYFSYNEALRNVKFIEADILKEDLNISKDLCILSYMINELSEENRLKVIDKVLKCTNKVLLIVEPGTPEGFKNIRKIRDYAFEKGYEIIAPCTGFNGRCDIPKDDWCASSVRVQRTKIHKYLKDAEVGFEDEKFSYVAINVEKDELDLKNNIKRILRHPKIQNGRIEVKTCLQGEIKEEIITKKNKEEFKSLKKKSVGDIL